MNRQTMSLRVAALILLVSVLWNHAEANTNEAIDCCLSTTNRRLPLQKVTAYIIQSSSGGCGIPATILITKKNQKLCAPPVSGNNWVAKLIKRFNMRSQNEKPKTRNNGKRKPKNRG